MTSFSGTSFDAPRKTRRRRHTQQAKVLCVWSRTETAKPRVVNHPDITRQTRLAVCLLVEPGLREVCAEYHEGEQTMTSLVQQQYSEPLQYLYSTTHAVAVLVYICSRLFRHRNIWYDSPPPLLLFGYEENVYLIVVVMSCIVLRTNASTPIGPSRLQKILNCVFWHDQEAGAFEMAIFRVGVYWVIS